MLSWVTVIIIAVVIVIPFGEHRSHARTSVLYTISTVFSRFPLPMTKWSLGLYDEPKVSQLLNGRKVNRESSHCGTVSK